MQIDDPAGIPGAEVRSADGDLLGQATVVHVPQGSSEPLFVQVTTGRDDDIESIIPLAQATMEGRSLVVPYSAERVKAGPAVEPDAVLSIGEAAYVVQYYGAGSVEVGNRSLTDRATAIGDISAQDPEVRRLPPIVVTRPGLQGDDDAIIVEPGPRFGGPN